MKRWLVAVGLFIALGGSLLLSWVGLYLLIRSVFALAAALLLLAAFSYWLSGPMTNLWKSDWPTTNFPLCRVRHVSNVMLTEE